MKDRFKQLQVYVDEDQRTIGEVYKKMHQLWDENNPEDTKEFYEHATKDQAFLYN